MIQIRNFSLLLASLLLITVSTLGQTNVPFRLSAKNLTAMDPFGGAPDPYVILTYENPPNPPFKLGETSKLANTFNPEWPEWFNVVHLNTSSQKITLDVWDEDIDADDYMGQVTFLLTEVMQSFGGNLERSILLNNSTMGQIIVSANVTKCD